MMVLIAVSLTYRSKTQNINQNRTQNPQVKDLSHDVRAILSAVLKINTQNRTQTHCIFSTTPARSRDELWLITKVALPALKPMLPANIAAMLS